VSSGLLRLATQVASEPICKSVELHVVSASAAEGRALDALEVRSPQRASPLRRSLPPGP